MDPQSANAARGRSPSAGQQHQPGGIRNSQSSPHPYPSPESTIGLGLGLDNSPSAPSVPQFSPSDFNINNSNPFLNTTQPPVFPGQAITDTTFASNPDFAQSFDSQGHADDFAQTLLASDFSTSGNPGGSTGGDFSLFPPTSQADQFSSPLFGDSTVNPNDVANMTTSQPHHSPTPPHLLKPDPLQPGSAHQSPSFNQHAFGSSPAGRHSRNTSLGPEAALLSGQVDWSQAQFQGHRRSPSEFSDVSSAAPSPNLPAQDTFETTHSEHGHSPLQRPQDGFYEGVNAGLGSFSISDPQILARSRSPSHSPAISPRMPPQQLPEMGQGNPGFALGGQQQGYVSAPTISYSMPQEQFPVLGDGSMAQQMATPSINIDFAPNSRMNAFEPAKPQMDQASLTPPDRGRPRSRPRAVTDPFNSGGPTISRPSTPGNLPQHLGAELRGRSPSESSRSLSPGDRSGSANAASRRRQSMSAVPNNVIALRLADPEYQAAQETGGNAKRAQKHPATFQCTLCPKRFTRAYNLRSHLRTHTDERPFVCTVCGKAFARQHDRKRHEGLHSGEKKFVCKGDLKAGGQWGCGRRFARADALGRHFRSEAGRICIKPLLDEEMIERQRAWNEQRMNAMAQNMAAHQATMAPAYPSMDGGFALPASILAQYPALAQMNWQTNDVGNVDDEISGRSSFDASDYDDGDDTGYVSGPGTGFGDGGMQQNFGDMGYTSDYGGR